MKILVTHCHTRMGHAVATSLTRAGHHVVAGATRAPTMSHAQSGVVAELAYPDPFADTEAFLACLERAAYAHQIELLFPVHEEVFVVAEHAARLRASMKVLSPSFEALLRAHDKANVPTLAAAAGIPIPLTRSVGCWRSAQRAFAEIGLPAVIKPRYGSGADGSAILHNARERDLAIARLRVSPPREMIVQRYAPGVGVAVAGLTWRGEVLALSGHRRLREVPIRGGTSTARETFVQRELMEATAALLPQLALDGVVMAEYRYDPSDDAFRLLEVNPRYFGGVATAIASGVDFPRLHLEASLERPPRSHVLPTRRVESRWLLGELRALAELVHQGRLPEAWRVLSKRSDLPVCWDDIDWKRPAGFYHQLRSYYDNWRRYDHFAGDYRAKQVFFARVTQRFKEAS